MKKIINKRRSNVILFAFGLLILFAAGFYIFNEYFRNVSDEGKDQPVEKLRTEKIEVVHDDGEMRMLKVEIAASEVEQERGLMYREKLGYDEGMLFVYEEDVRYGFWMRNTLIPLDIYFFDENLKIIDSKLGFQPCKSKECELYAPKSSYRYALEVNPQEIGIKGFYWDPQ